MPRHRLATVLGACLLPTALACGATGPAGSPSTDTAETGDDHGAIAGAIEVDEAPVGLTTVDPRGVVRHLDLLDETTSTVAEVGPVDRLATDGRYLFADTPGGLAVVDSGVWTWDHVDHFHYYRAEPRALGTVDGSGPATVATSATSTSGGTGAFFAETGEVVVLDNAALSRGELVERFRVTTDPHDGMVVPLGEHALVTVAGGSDGGPDAVEVLDEAGDRVPGTEAACPAARGTITTRVGAVIGCADGALLATEQETGPALERVPHPMGSSAAPATSFAGREGRPTVAGLAGPRGTDGIWLLDTRDRSWRLLPSPEPLVQVAAVDDESEHVLGVTQEGRLLVLDGATGSALSRSEPLVADSVAAGREVTLVVDQQRAYLGAPLERRLHEIDFADDARVARSFTTEAEPSHVAGTGR